MTRLTPSAKPQLRFNGFQGSWTICELGDYLTFKNGINADKDSYGSGYKFISVLDIINNDFITNELITGTVNVDKKTFEKNEVLYGDLLFQRSSENREEAGQSNVYLDHNNSSCFGGFVIRGRAKRKYNPVFLNYLLKTDLARKEIVSKSGGSTRYNVGQDTLSEVKIYISGDETEQQKIADFLSAVDKKISLLKEKHALLAQYKKGVMQKLFKQEIRFKDDSGSDFPDWQWKQGNEFFDAISNKSHNSDLPILAITQEHGAIPRDLINYQVQVTDGSVASYKVVEEGDYIISLRSFQGGIEYSRYKGICSPAYIILRPSISIDDDFYRYYLKTGKFIQEMKRRLEGIRDGKILSYKYFSEIKLPYPCIEEQRKISQFINTLDKKISLVKEQIELNQTFKKGLLQQMFV
ncbi:restriction endonuclease subunit S [Alteromonas sp. B31-7]|uniref:restriction endonuclease subunit S n=1 Tax=Alteromonas sp. B31-7 TaxID=2785913 RepID=UPI0018CAD0D9|nr:restriction endonuclease subunit S [Alteromonas sp. B31-7]QPL50802.1 restriction endonuclease subunit S [Alteromonas sp. B31-7]